MKSPAIAIYLSEKYVNDESYPNFGGVDSFYEAAMSDLLKEIIKQGGKPFLVFNAGHNYIARKTFRVSWQVELVDDLVKYNFMSKPIQVDILYNRSWLLSELPGMATINPRAIYDVCGDKYLSYLMTPDFHPTSYLITNENQLTIFLSSHRNNFALKELRGFGGEQVFVGKLSNYNNQLQFPLLAQEFVDTSNGAPGGMASGTHDIRIELFNNQPIGGLLRTPPSGSLKSNHHLGGTSKALLVQELPIELVNKTRIINERFTTDKPRMFSADWGFDKVSNSWKLFELNASPGLKQEKTDGEAANEYLHLLAYHLVNNVK